jgi:phosphate acetyltransferase
MACRADVTFVERIYVNTFQQKFPKCAEDAIDVPFYHDLIAGCEDRLKPLRTAVVHPVSGNALAGAAHAAESKWLEVVLIGPKDSICKAAEESSLDISNFEIIVTKYSAESAQVAADMAREGKVDALMKGHIHTNELLRSVMDKKNGLRTDRRMSHVFVIDVPGENYCKPLWLSDAAINIRPTLQDKKDITQNAIDLFRAGGFGVPKVAILSATERITEDIPSTVAAAALCKMADRGYITGGIVDGPLAFDDAISKSAADVKQIVSEVAGDADILIVPDLESGNMLYKQMKFLSGYNAAGIVVGAQIPVILTSRSSGRQARLASAALALLYASHRKSGKS